MIITCNTKLHLKIMLPSKQSLNQAAATLEIVAGNKK